MKGILRYLCVLLLMAYLAANGEVYAQQGVAYDFSAAAPTGQMLYYKITGGNNVEVTYPNNALYYHKWYGYAEPDGDLVIPAEVVYDCQTYYVTAIGSHTFEW